MTAPAQAPGVRDDAATNGHVPMTPELNAMLWVQQEAREGRPLPILETGFVADALWMGMRPEGELTLPLLPLGDMEHYLGVHAINVATLSMGLANFLEFDEDAVRKVGMAALLHDIGMVRIPSDIAAQPGQIDASDRERVKIHPVEGARIIMAASDPSLDLAAVVAYEHHIKMDGSGYPRVLYPRTGHYVSRLVQLCDIYHALRSPRPFRDAWPRPIIYSFLNERAGFEFHPALAAALTRMAQQLDPDD